MNTSIRFFATVTEERDGKIERKHAPLIKLDEGQLVPHAYDAVVLGGWSYVVEDVEWDYDSSPPVVNVYLDEGRERECDR